MRHSENRNPYLPKWALILLELWREAARLARQMKYAEETDAARRVDSRRA